MAAQGTDAQRRPRVVWIADPGVIGDRCRGKKHRLSSALRTVPAECAQSKIFALNSAIGRSISACQRDALSRGWPNSMRNAKREATRQPASPNLMQRRIRGQRRCASGRDRMSRRLIVSGNAPEIGTSWSVHARAATRPLPLRTCGSDVFRVVWGPESRGDRRYRAGSRRRFH